MNTGMYMSMREQALLRAALREWRQVLMSRVGVFGMRKETYDAHSLMVNVL